MTTITGKMLKIDLSTGKIEVVDISREWTKLFIGGEGFGRKDEKLPVRLSSEPAPDGLGEGNVANEEVMLDEFYESMGWDKETGQPTEETLRKLKLM